MRDRKRVTETASICNTTGVNDDTRASCSIPTRHDLCHRVDANYRTRLVARHQVDLEEAPRMTHDLRFHEGYLPPPVASRWERCGPESPALQTPS